MEENLETKCPSKGTYISMVSMLKYSTYKGKSAEAQAAGRANVWALLPVYRNCQTCAVGVPASQKCMGLKHWKNPEMRECSSRFLLSVQVDDRQACSTGIRAVGDGVVGDLECEK